MKRILVFISIILCLLSQAQDTIKIPQGVIYIKVSAVINQIAKELLVKELSNSQTYNLFDSITIIGPNLWQRYSKVKNVSEIKQGDISLKVTSYNSKSAKIVAAKLIQRRADYITVVKQLRKELNHKPLKFRALNSLDLQYYWAVIFFDIEEPVYIIEANSKKFLIDVDNNKIKWIDEVF